MEREAERIRQVLVVSCWLEHVSVPQGIDVDRRAWQSLAALGCMPPTISQLVLASPASR